MRPRGIATQSLKAVSTLVFLIISIQLKNEVFILFFIFIYLFDCMGSWASLVAQMVKNMPAMWKTWVQFLGWEDPLEEGMTTHSSILAWEIPWTEEPGRLQSIGLQKSQTQLSD